MNTVPPTYVLVVSVVHAAELDNLRCNAEEAMKELRKKGLAASGKKVCRMLKRCLFLRISHAMRGRNVVNPNAWHCYVGGAVDNARPDWARSAASVRGDC